MFELHVLPSLRWRNVILADRPTPTRSIGPFAIDPWIGWAKRALLPILAVSPARLEERRRVLEFGPGELAASRPNLAKLFGDDLGDRLIERIASDDLNGVLGLVPVLRRSAALRALVRSPLYSLAWPLRALSRIARLPFSRCAPTVAIVGPDGAGKSTLLRELARTEGWVFTDVVERHWRPNVLPHLGRLIGRASHSPGETSPPRREPGRFQWLRLLYYALDVWIGTWFRDRPAASRQKLLLYDRCYLDMAVDPARYGLRSARGILKIWSLLPRPDRVIALAADPDALWERKREISPMEISAQQDEWKSLAALGYVDDVLDAGRSVESLVDELRAIVVRAFLDLNGGVRRD